MSRYNKIKLIVKLEKYEELIANLMLLGIESFEEITDGLVFYTDDTIEYNAEEIISVIKKKFPDIVIKLEEFIEKKWNELWEKSIEPVYIKDKIVIYPSWKKNTINRIFPVKIEIDPKMSFGTGHNGTTQIVLELMCNNLGEEDKFMLDFGSGTGILSIAAIKSGVEKVIAIDTDKDAIENSKEYFKTNDVQNSVVLIQCSISDVKESDFDIITANIISEVIKKNISIIYSKLKPGGKLFLSGILIDEKKDITEFLQRNNFKVINISEKEEWLGIFCLKN
ncbi:MAG: 50S ribosomal protein L11 methyltransferase [Ignavibacteria bacterium]|nr:50S ribosomal protein L11 methyltransferase [Ignavibacteria bacterium]